MSIQNVKQVILVRKDLYKTNGKPVGFAKLAVQVAHASLTAITNLMYVETEELDNIDTQVVYRELITNSNSPLNLWLTGSQTKICLAVNSLEELNKYFDLAQKAMLPCSYIIDNGLTVFNGIQTPTCIAIGPSWSADIDEITSKLKLYN